MKSRVLLVATVILVLASPTLYSDSGNRRQTLEAVILVSDRFETADTLEEWVENGGGYLVSRLEDQLVLRVRSELLDEFVDFLETTADEVIQVQQETEEISQDLLEAEAGIKSKTELFERALTLIDQTDFSTTLEIEREVLSILEDIERLEGRYRKLLGEVELARVEIDFTLEEEKLPQNLPSAFAWINVVDFYLLMQEFGRN